MLPTTLFKHVCIKQSSSTFFTVFIFISLFFCYLKTLSLPKLFSPEVALSPLVYDGDDTSKEEDEHESGSDVSPAEEEEKRGSLPTHQVDVIRNPLHAPVPNKHLSQRYSYAILISTI